MLRQVRLKKNHNKQKQKKDYRQWYFGTINEKGSLEFNTVKNEIENKFNTTISSTTFPMKVTIENTNYIVDNKGKVEIKEIVSAEYNRDGIEIGDYIDYVPDIVSTPYPQERVAFKYTGAHNDDIPQEHLKWRILRKYDDGSMDIISDSTTKKIGLNLSQGYNNGVFLLNDIARTLYSKPSKGIYARSLNWEDDEYWLNTTPENHKTQMSISEEIIMNKNVGDKIDIIDYMQSQNNKSRSDSIITELLEPNQIEKTLTQNTTIKRSGYYIVYPFSDYGKAEHILGEMTSESWRATRVDGMIYYNDGTAMGDRMFAPGYGGILCLRSVVRLNSTTKLQKSINASNAAGTPHKILEY